MPLNLIFIQPGNYTIDDNGVPGDNISVIRDGNGVVIFTFAHPADALGFTVSTPGVNSTIDFTDSLGAANFSLGNLTDPAQSLSSIVMDNVITTGTVTLVSNGAISEGGADGGSDIVAGALIMSAGTGIGSGNAIETRTSLFEAETTTGGINVSNFGSVQIGGLSADVDGLRVATSGNIDFTTLGSIFLTESNSVTAAEVVRGGSTSGNVTLTAIGANSDIIGNVDNGAITAPRGNISVTAGRDVQLGTIGANFNNDVVGNGAVAINAGRDVLIDGFADILSDNFGLNTGGNMTITAGRNIGILQVAGTSASVTASGSGGADLILTTGFGGSLTVNAPGSFAAGSTSGDVVVNADRILIDAGSGISAPSGQVFLRPATAGWAIDLGSVTDGAFALELSDAELDRVFTPSLTIGGATSGTLTVSAAISPLNVTNLTLLAGDNISLQSSITVSGALVLNAGDDVLAFPGVTINAASLTILADQVGNDGNTGAVVNLSNIGGTAPINVIGSVDADTFTGNAAANSLTGAGGADTLYGGAGIDGLNGGLGADALYGGDDADTLYGGDDADSIYGGQGTDGIDAGTGNDFVYGGTEADGISGGAGGDSIYGGAGSDTIYGGDVGDVILGGLDSDSLAGDAGNDTIYGDDGYANTGSADNIAGGEGNDSLFGNGGDDTIYGGNGDDAMQGQDGADILRPQAGYDYMTGGAGADKFLFDTAGFQQDTIWDFTHLVDKIMLNHTIFANFAAVQAATTQNGAHTFITGVGGDRIVLANFTANTLTAADFTFF